jgi:ribosome-binding factor A
MSEIKRKRAANQLQLLLSELVRAEVDDPRVAGVTITEVRLDREMEHATIFVAALAGDRVRDDVLSGLTSAQGFLRRELGRRMHVRRVPALHFYWDAGLAHGERIAQLLDGLHDTGAPAPAAAVEDDDDAVAGPG